MRALGPSLPKFAKQNEIPWNLTWGGVICHRISYSDSGFYSRREKYDFSGYTPIGHIQENANVGSHNVVQRQSMNSSKTNYCLILIVWVGISCTCAVCISSADDFLARCVFSLEEIEQNWQ